ncbi:MAG: hypothetical protein ACK52I_24460 [Pseudomonadota bacterium]|jgi:hypothetical protein|nr:hypothetical protein [Silanimonas sp.]MCZ8116181.1 hypothetical protein [Silanimonas sp.]
MQRRLRFCFHPLDAMGTEGKPLGAVLRRLSLLRACQDKQG